MGQNQNRKPSILSSSSTREGEQELISGNTTYKMHNYTENGHDRLTFNNDANVISC